MRIELELQDFDTLIIAAFRYALGRMTYIVEDFCMLYMKKESIIPYRTKQLILREIKLASHENGLGMDMDKENWLELYAHLLSQGVTLSEPTLEAAETQATIETRSIKDN